MSDGDTENPRAIPWRKFLETIPPNTHHVVLHLTTRTISGTGEGKKASG